MSPSPTVKNRFSSIFCGTLPSARPLNRAVNELAVFVSFQAGSCGRIGGVIGLLLLLLLPCLVLQGAELYSRIAVVVVLSKAIPGALE